MIKPNVAAAVNKQIAHEQANAHAYQQVAAYFENLNLHGFSAFMAKQVDDERDHAQRFITHLHDRGAEVKLETLPAPKADFANPLEAVRTALELERATTRTIHDLYDLADKEKDYGLKVLLHWFISEQVEEEAWAEELEELMAQFWQSPGQLYMLDHHWGKRAKKDD